MAEPAQKTRPAGERSQSAPAEIAFRSVVERYPARDTPAVENLSFEVPPGEICVLIGPSGCGKTTALKMVNRLIAISDGDITIDGASVRQLELTQLRRGIGYVFQQIGLFPHLSVENNIGTVPRLLGWPKERIRARASELLELVGLDPSADLKRYPGEFSGGQQQRIGVARAMAADPPIMPMDEPFGAVDPIARDRADQRPDRRLPRVHRRVGRDGGQDQQVRQQPAAGVRAGQGVLRQTRPGRKRLHAVSSTSTRSPSRSRMPRDTASSRLPI
jgi:ABC-type proline/glycine betaine transport system ATPase subunit